MLLYFPFIFLWGEILIVMCSSEKEVLQTPPLVHKTGERFLYLLPSIRQKCKQLSYFLQ